MVNRGTARPEFFSSRQRRTTATVPSSPTLNKARDTELRVRVRVHARRPTSLPTSMITSDSAVQYYQPLGKNSTHALIAVQNVAM